MTQQSSKKLKSIHIWPWISIFFTTLINIFKNHDGEHQKKDSLLPTWKVVKKYVEEKGVTDTFFFDCCIFVFTRDMPKTNIRTLAHQLSSFHLFPITRIEWHWNFFTLYIWVCRLFSNRERRKSGMWEQKRRERHKIRGYNHHRIRRLYLHHTYIQAFQLGVNYLYLSVIVPLPRRVYHVWNWKYGLYPWNAIQHNQIIPWRQIKISENVVVKKLLLLIYHPLLFYHFAC